MHREKIDKTFIWGHFQGLVLALKDDKKKEDRKSEKKIDVDEEESKSSDTSLINLGEECFCCFFNI